MGRILDRRIREAMPPSTASRARLVASTPAVRRPSQRFRLVRGDGNVFRTREARRTLPDPAYNERHHASEFHGSPGLHLRVGTRARDPAVGLVECRDRKIPSPNIQAGQPDISDAGRSFRRAGRATASAREALWHFFNICCMNPASVDDRIELDPGSILGFDPGCRPARSPNTNVGRIRDRRRGGDAKKPSCELWDLPHRAPIPRHDPIPTPKMTWGRAQSGRWQPGHRPRRLGVVPAGQGRAAIPQFRGCRLTCPNMDDDPSRSSVWEVARAGPSSVGVCRGLELPWCW
jgi:hypothetical protein